MDLPDDGKACFGEERRGPGQDYYNGQIGGVILYTSPSSGSRRGTPGPVKARAYDSREKALVLANKGLVSIPTQCPGDRL